MRSAVSWSMTANASAILAAAKDIVARGLAIDTMAGQSRVYLCDVVDALRVQNAGWTVAQIHSAIAGCVTEIYMGECDLNGAYDQDKLARSTVQASSRAGYVQILYVL